MGLIFVGLAALDEVYKLGSTSKGSSSHEKFTDNINLDEVLEYMQNMIRSHILQHRIYLSAKVFHVTSHFRRCNFDCIWRKNQKHDHAEIICDLSSDRRDVIGMLKEPSTGKEVHKRKGFHSRPVVRGVVGLQMPK